MKRRKRILLLFGVPLLGFGLIVLGPISFPIGETRVEKSLVKLDKDAPHFPHGFAHASWDGPTGSMSSGDCYTVRIGDWLWRLDIRRVGLDEKYIP